MLYENRYLIGASQYFYKKSLPVLAYPQIRKIIKTLLNQFFSNFSKISPTDNVVFDVALFLDKTPHVKLIEINPFHPLTEACLYSWEKILISTAVFDMQKNDSPQGSERGNL